MTLKTGVMMLKIQLGKKEGNMFINCNSEYYCFNWILDQINADPVSIRDLCQNNNTS